MTDGIGAGQFAALGTTVTVLTADPGALDSALALVRMRVRELDLAASRFRADSELMALHRARGKPIAVSETLYVALREAIDAAEETAGVLDPSVGEALEHCGYDRDFSQICADGPAITAQFRRVPGWRGVRLEQNGRTASIPAGVKIDLGATAKAGCADRSAADAARAVGSGVLVNLGGDIAVAGEAPPEGWIVRVADRHDATPDELGVTLAISVGGLATSGTAVRRWRRGAGGAALAARRRAGAPRHRPGDRTTGETMVEDRHRRRSKLRLRQCCLHRLCHPRPRGTRLARSAGLSCAARGRKRRGRRGGPVAGGRNGTQGRGQGIGTRQGGLIVGHLEGRLPIGTGSRRGRVSGSQP